MHTEQSLPEWSNMPGRSTYWNLQLPLCLGLQWTPLLQWCANCSTKCVWLQLPAVIVNEYLLSVVQLSSAVGFRGDGYIELPLSMLPHASPQVTEVISMTIRTDQSDGLLLWHGQKPTTSGRAKDYLAVALEGGRIVFR